jgi:hypothetical protein
MINNNNSYDSNIKSNHYQHWWKKMIGLFFGHWTRQSKYTDYGMPSHEGAIEQQQKVKASLKDWMNAVDTLQPLVQSIRANANPADVEDFDLELLGANTYLFHIDRLLVKVREYFINFRYRQEQANDFNELVNKAEYIQAIEAAQQCYHTIINLTTLIQKLPHKKLYSEDFINQIHAFELEVTTLGSSVRMLNKLVYRQEALLQLSALEQDLLQTLGQGQQSTQNTYSFNEIGSNHGLMYRGDYLRTKSQMISVPEYFTFISSLIDVHDMLKKCYVVARKSVVKDSLDMMSENIEGLIDVLLQNEPEKNLIFNYLAQIFNTVEALRFSTNRESRCSRNLFEKSKLARNQLRKICLKHDIAREFLKTISVSRVTLLRPPK